MTQPSADSIEAGAIPDDHPHSPRMPPRWFVRTAWVLHRALYRGTGGRRGLWAPKPGKWGTMRLVTVGRRSGKEREAIVAYFEDGPNLVTMAMNGWAEGEPAWWLNLQAQPDVTVELKGTASRAVRGRVAEGVEREQLWQTWRSYTDGLDGYATRRTETAVIVLEPRPVKGAGGDRSLAEAQEAAGLPSIDG
jgi:deazaflavin-dependent oxidoreductase (nitroreductase family)